MYVLPFALFVLLALAVLQRPNARLLSRGSRMLWREDAPPTYHADRYYQARAAAMRHVWPRAVANGDLQNELWEKVKHDVVIGVKTGHEVAAKRLDKLRRTGWWSVGRDIPNLLVISDRDDDALGVIGVKEYGMTILQNAPPHDTSNTTVHAPAAHASAPQHWFDRSGWRGDKDKNLPAFHLLRRTFPGKKWYLLLDDDTYLFAENFARYIFHEGMDEQPIYTGKVFYISRCGGFGRDGTWLGNHSAPRGMFAHGGSGIILNAKALDAMYTSIPHCIRQFSSCWAGDMQVGLCLRQAGVVVRRVQPHNSFERNYIPFWPSKALADRRYSGRWKSEEEPLTFHKIPDEEQRLLSDFEKNVVQSGETVVYHELRKHLLANGIVPAHSAHDKKNRFYSTEFSPKHLK